MSNPSGSIAGTSAVHSKKFMPCIERGTRSADQQRQVLIYPEGEIDAVTITVGDVQGLERPTGFLSDNVIDFYIKYLQKKSSISDNGRFYFFNSFFFTKLVLESDQGKVGYEQVRKWTGDVNLFEKDYVFIPVNQRSHWSLIIICHLPCLAISHDTACILHLDSYSKGEIHKEGIETHIRKYIAQAWMEKHQAKNGHQRVSRMHFVQIQAPQQENFYDCGIYLLHYVELFLKELTSLAFAPNQSNLHFVTKDWFESSDVSSKRLEIINLIYQLCEESKKNTLRPEPKKRKRDVNWTVDETSTLIKTKKECFENGSRTCKGKSDWAAIAAKMPTERTGYQCRSRWDTLFKSYQTIKKYCSDHDKSICDLTKLESAELKLATTMSENWWYEAIQSCQPGHRKDTSLKSGNINFTTPAHCPLHPPFSLRIQVQGEGRESSRKRVAVSKSSDLLLPIRSSDSQPTSKHIQHQNKSMSGIVASPKQINIPEFNSMSHDLKCTLLNLIQAWPTVSFNGEFEAVCRWLAIIQDQKPADTRLYVQELVKRNIVNFSIKGKLIWLELGLLRVYKQFAKKAIRDHYNVTQCHRVGDNGLVTFESTSLPNQIRVLTLRNCCELKRVRLGKLPMLRSLVIKNCPLLEDISGWDTVGELRWLEIDECRSYSTYPDVHSLPRLREACFERGYSREAPVGFEPNFSRCTRLSRLEIWNDGHLRETGDLTTLKCLHALSLINCQALSTITGLRRLHSLQKLNLGGCTSLRRLPGLGKLESLKELELTRSGVEEISGVLQLHSLTHLDLGFCKALKTLPYLGHLTELYHLNISGSGVEAISGIEHLHCLTKLDLSGCEALQSLPFLGHLTALAEFHADYCLSLEEIPGVHLLRSLQVLDLYKSQVTVLPDLRHLPRLQCVYLFDTPVTRNPSSIYFRKEFLNFNEELEAENEVSDISDHEYVHSDEEVYKCSHGYYPPKHPGVWH